MTRQVAARIAGAFEHPRRKIPDRTVPQVLAEVAYGALADAGLSLSDVDGFFCSEVPGLGSIAMADYLGLTGLSYVDVTEGGGASYLMHVGHATAAVASGKCKVALVAMAGLPLSGVVNRGGGGAPAPEHPYESGYGVTVPAGYALAAQRHMYEFGTTSEQLAEVKVAAAHHAQFNPNAKLRQPVTIEEVVNSPLISDPLHRLDCCITTDGGGALVIVSEDVARTLPRRTVKILGHGETVKHSETGRIDLSYTGAAISGPRAFAEAGLTPRDVDYVSIYDSFTITVLMSLEDLGFCEKGKGGAFVSDGALRGPDGMLPFNTDGGGLCNNHPDFRGGMVRTIEAVRQLRGEAAPEVQVPGCRIGLVQGHGGSIGFRTAAATLLLGAEDA
ncbi:thiolase domain-containing protein [Amycolatopsis pithecellobii]|uniref:Thiolase domain-containing protein n=1 Tax=Amycolatopsis pithecellobii TaxID=664692 RepID=A0A6N7YLR2_9PSEU|nr:thiolase domain-containing protein [Amycolatopsis pithecellobii]MTD52972.1 thiolase domain-containing protein [Amycolatopsis pithecellobii]